jgi:hypothetical protein
MEKEAAEEKLVWAVETVLREQQRREVEGVKPDEGEWMSSEELGGSLEGQHYITRIASASAKEEAALGHHYEERNQHYLAAPLFLQAVALSPPSSCHTTVLSEHPQENLWSWIC